MPTADFELKGIDKFMRKLTREIRQLKRRTHKGLIEAALILQREAEPGTPIDTGNLRASWFTVSFKSGVESDQPSFKGPDSTDMKKQHTLVTSKAKALANTLGSDENPVVVFGYSANYAVFVHENVDATFQRPTAHPRWLFKALLRSRLKMLTAIRHEARFR